MSEFQASNFKKENGGTPDLLGKTELTSPYFFVPPSGTTAERPQSCAAGTLRFNTDIGTLEIYRGDTIGWEQIVKRESQYLGGGTGSNTGTGTRGLFYAGQNPGEVDTIDFITISTLGNAQDFGNATDTRDEVMCCASRTRGVGGGGYDGGTDDKIDFVTFSSTGNATGECANGIFYIYNANNSSEKTFFTQEVVLASHTSLLAGFQGGCIYNPATQVEGVQIFAGADNIQSGTFTLYKVV